MIEKFLHAKPWQIFIITSIIPIIVLIIFQIILFSNFQKETEFDEKIMIIFPVLFLIAFIGMFSWYWSVAIGLQPKVPNSIKMKTYKFKLSFFIPMIYFLFLILFFFYVSSDFVGNKNINIGMFAILFILHLTSIIGIFYTIYFVAKTYKTVEMQREVKFREFIAEFFLFWFQIIGVWILQPKVNEMSDL